MSKTLTLTWFKLPTALIIQPKFQRLSTDAQAGFITLCCVYWQDGGVMTYDDAQQNAEGIDELVQRGYVEVEDGLISIEFLDEQLGEVSQQMEQRRQAGRKSAQARVERKVNDRSTTVQRPFNESSTDKIRREEKRKEEIDREIDRESKTRVNADDLEADFYEVEEVESLSQATEDQKEKVPPKRKRFEPPTEAEAQLFFQATDNPQAWEGFYNYYLANGWRVGKNPMKDWQAAARGWVSREKTYSKSTPHHNGNRTNAQSIAANIAVEIANGDWDITKG